MSNLFSGLVSKGLFNDWALILDWLFDENKFNNWKPGDIRKLTEKIQKLPKIKKANYQYGSISSMEFPKRMSKKILRFLLAERMEVVRQEILLGI